MYPERIPADRSMTPPPSAPSDPPSAPASGPDALDPHEAQLLRLLTAEDRPALDAFIDALPAALAEPPEAEPEAGRRSSAELVALARAGTGAPQGCPAGALRAGYLVDGSSGRGSTRVLAAFAEALAAGTTGDALRARFPDLWAVDLAVWEALDAPPKELARMWLESPGRRLLQDLRALRKLPSEDRVGATLGTLARIHQAAGVDGAPTPADVAAFAQWKRKRPAVWLELHLTAPGRAMLSWAPRDESPVSALQALELVEEASPLSLRGAALGWSLRRMNEKPRYEVGGISRDLRDELPARLAGALEGKRASSARAPADLEEISLAHAVRINAGDTGPGGVFRTWGVARWLASCLWRSPFFGGDEPTLVERLRALVPSTGVVHRADALDAIWFERARGLDIEEVALVGGALALEARGSHGLVIPPSPLVRALKKIAGRGELRADEEKAEDLLARGANEMGWPAVHVAPPLAARWWLTERQVRWLGEVPEAAQLQTLSLLSTAPARFGWSCFAVMEEGGRSLRLGKGRGRRDLAGLASRGAGAESA
jgi:hypothetical protein